MLAKNILQAPEAQLLSLDALVPWCKYQSIAKINNEIDVQVSCEDDREIKEIMVNGL